jgi:hypothetical protein
MINRVIIYLGTLGFEVFGLKIPILQVLDCHDSPGRASARHAEQTQQKLWFPRLGEQTAPKCVVGSFRQFWHFRVDFSSCSLSFQKYTPQAKTLLDNL